MLFCLQFLFFTYSWSFCAYTGKVRLRRALRDCKHRNLTVSKKTPSVRKKKFPLFGRETKHVKTEHVKIDRAHNHVYFREHCRVSREHAVSWESSWGPSAAFCTENLNLRGQFRGHLRAHSSVHFREHFRERVCGSNFAVRVL